MSVLALRNVGDWWQRRPHVLLPTEPTEYPRAVPWSRCCASSRQGHTEQESLLPTAGLEVLED